MTFTTEQWLAELERTETLADDANFFRTAYELSQVWKCSVRKAIGWLHKADQLGRLETARVIRRAIDGKRVPVAAYRIKPSRGASDA